MTSSKVTPSAVNVDFCAIADFSAIAREDAKRLASKKQDIESPKNKEGQRYEGVRRARERERQALARSANLCQ